MYVSNKGIILYRKIIHNFVKVIISFLIRHQVKIIMFFNLYFKYN